MSNATNTNNITNTNNNPSCKTKKKCTVCQFYCKQDKNCTIEKNNCTGFDFAKCEDYLVADKLVMF